VAASSPRRGRSVKQERQSGERGQTTVETTIPAVINAHSKIQEMEQSIIAGRKDVVIRPTDVAVSRCRQVWPDRLGAGAIGLEVAVRYGGRVPLIRFPILPSVAMTIIGRAVFCSFFGLGIRKSDPDRRSRL